MADPDTGNDIPGSGLLSRDGDSPPDLEDEAATENVRPGEGSRGGRAGRSDDGRTGSAGCMCDFRVSRADARELARVLLLPKGERR